MLTNNKIICIFFFFFTKVASVANSVKLWSFGAGGVMRPPLLAMSPKRKLKKIKKDALLRNQGRKIRVPFMT